MNLTLFAFGIGKRVDSSGRPLVFASVNWRVHSAEDVTTRLGDPRSRSLAFDRASWALLASFICVVAVAWYSSPRGFDLLDSGCYYLEYAFPHDSADTHTSYRFFASPVYYALGESVVLFRWVSWLFVWGAAWVFAHGWRRLMATFKPGFASWLSWPAILAAFLHASSAMYTIKPAALTYNSLNLVGVFVSLGLFFSGLTHLGGTVRLGERRGLALVVAAVLVALVDFFIKPTTSAYLLTGYVIFFLVSPMIPRSAKRKALLLGGAVTLVGALATLAALGGPAAIFARLRTLAGILENRAYMGVLLTRVVREFGELAAFLWGDLRWPGLVLLVTSGLLAATRGRVHAQRIIGWVGGIGLLGAWGWRMIASGLWRGSHQLYFEGVVARAYLSAMVLAVGVAWVSRLLVAHPAQAVHARRGHLASIGVFLVLTPFAGAFGTTTSIYLNGALYSACWVAVILGALVETGRVWGVRWHIPTVLAPLIALSIAQLVHGQIMMPYMNPRPLWEQTEPTEMGVSGAKVRLDPALHAFIEDTRFIMEEHGFKRGDDVFCFFNIPGLVYAIGGRSPIIPWYFGRIYVDDRVEEWHVQHASAERRSQAWIVTQADATRFRESYLRSGIDFPDGYERIGTLTNPVTQMEVGIWKSRALRP